MKKLLTPILALLLSASVALAQSYPSPTYNNLTLNGALFFNNCSGVVIANGASAAACYATVPNASLPLGTSGATIPLLSTANTWGATQTFPGVALSGHVWGSGSAPTPSACGTSPSLSTGANDNHGTVTVGTGTPNACTLTFAAAYTNTPDCVVKSLANVTISTIAPTTTYLYFTFTGTSSAKFTYICMGL